MENAIDILKKMQLVPNESKPVDQARIIEAKTPHKSDDQHRDENGYAVTAFNKDVVQPYVISAAKYDFSIREKRILYRIVEAVQYYYSKKRLSGTIQVDKETRQRKINIPVKSVLVGDKNHTQIYKALEDLRKKTFTYEDKERFVVQGIIDAADHVKYGDSISVTVSESMFTALMSFGKGYRKFELLTAMSFKSVYTMRLYELVSGKTEPIIYKISALRDILCLENRYKGIGMLKNRVLERAKNELIEKAPYSFQYEFIKDGRRYTKVKLSPFYIEKNRDQELLRKELSKQTSLSWDIPSNYNLRLRIDLGFTKQEIQNNRETIANYFRLVPLTDAQLSKLIKRASSKSNPKGYMINAMKSELKKVLVNKSS